MKSIAGVCRISSFFIVFDPREELKVDYWFEALVSVSMVHGQCCFLGLQKYGYDHKFILTKLQFQTAEQITSDWSSYDLMLQH